MTSDRQTRTRRAPAWARHSRRGLLGLAAGIWLVGCTYGLFTAPVDADWPCGSHPYAGETTTRLLILEIVFAVALALAVSITERARRLTDPAEEAAAQPISRTLWSAVIVWSLFGLIALQITGIAPFLGYIPITDLPQAQKCALLLICAATITFGAAAVAHTVSVAGDNPSRSSHATPMRRQQPVRALIIGVLIGIGLAVPVCVSNWNNPDICMALHT